MRSLNVALRQVLDLYTCYRPVRYFSGVPSPVKKPEDVNMHIFRENTEDIYAGIEFMEGTPEADRLKKFLIAGYGRKINKISRNFINWHQACFKGRFGKAYKAGYHFRPEKEIAFGDTGSQGKHYEVYRRSIYEMGICPG